MTSTLPQRLAGALALAQAGVVPPAATAQGYAPFLGAGLRLVQYKKGEYIAHVGHPLRHVLVLLCGECHVFNYSAEGKSIRKGVCAAPQVLGLFEALNTAESHSATIEALTTCCLIEVPAAVYVAAIQESPQAMWYSLRCLATFIGRILSQSDSILLNTPRQNLLLRFYESCKGRPYPVKLAIAKNALAEELNLNPRTLYRNLHQLREEGLIGSQTGKITIEEAQHKKIGDLLREMLLLPQ